MKRYYLPFEPKAKSINYLYLFELIEIAEYNKESQAFDTIHYTSIKQLAEKLSFSQATLNRILCSNEYSFFLSIDRQNKIIKLLNSFSSSKGALNKPFVVLIDKEVQLLKQMHDNLFCRYLIYVKYYCGFSKTKVTDFTANQFLVACGYSENSNANKEKISQFNALLVANKLLKIERYTDDLGHLRNRYYYQL